MIPKQGMGELPMVLAAMAVAMVLPEATQMVTEEEEEAGVLMAPQLGPAMAAEAVVLAGATDHRAVARAGQEVAAVGLLLISALPLTCVKVLEVF